MSDLLLNQEPAREWLLQDVSGFMALATGSARYRWKIGAAIIDSQREQLQLYQFVDNDAGQQLENLMNRLKPKTCLIPNAAGAETTQYACHFAVGTEVRPLDKKVFDDNEGLLAVIKYCKGSENVANMEIKDKHYALTAVGALFSIPEVSSLPEKSLDLVVRGSDSTMAIDRETIQNLEVFSSATGNHNESLFGLLNRTHTAIGKLFLRNCLFEPSTNKAEIVARQDCVQELLKNQNLLDGLIHFLQLFEVDMDKITDALTKSPRGETSTLVERQIDVVVFLKHAISLLSRTLLPILNSCQSELFKRFREIVTREDFMKIQREIEKFIVDECVLSRGSLNFRTSKVFAIRPEVDVNLQLKRKVYLEILEEMNNIVSTLEKQFVFGGSLKLVYTVGMDYHLEISRAKLDDKDLQYPLRVLDYDQTRVKCTTDLLRFQNTLLKQCMMAIISLSHSVMQPLLDFLKEQEQIESIYDLKDVIAYLDFLVSLALVARDNDMKRPTFGEITDMKECANPIFIQLQKISSHKPVVTNDFHMTPALPLVFLTGPNMSGKSSFIRQIALLQIMAQIGSFLPAKDNPKIRIMNQILTRIGADDDLVSNLSSFMQEVSQVEFILSRAGNNSLVIIDELGRGTSDEEGVALCIAVCEALLQKPGTFTLFATHFHDLVRLQYIYPFIDSYQMEYSVQERSEDFQYSNFSHKVIQRPPDDSKIAGECYGMELAQKLGTMPQLVKDAMELLPRVEIYRKEVQVEASNLKSQLLLARHLLSLSKSEVMRQRPSIGDYLKRLKEKFLKQ